MIGLDIKIKWNGLREFKKYMKDGSKVVDKIILEELNNVGLIIEGYGKRLSPRDRGDLEASITSDKAYKSGDRYICIIGTNMIYAKYVHDGVGRGPRTLKKPNVKGYRPGPLYLRNATTLAERDFEIAIARAVVRVLNM